jgi:ferrous iron transport protein B
MQAIKKSFSKLRQKDSCCGSGGGEVPEGLKKVAIVGNPNVGKSVLFNNLTKHYVTVSNYPGTSVEVSRGSVNIGDREFEVIDTPGIYSLSPLTEEERVARRILLREELSLVIHVVDAKNLERMLPFTLQLIESHLPTVLVLNMMDEAGKNGVEIDIPLLEKELGIPVVGTVSTSGEGMDILKRRIVKHAKQQ